jgi:hypothetical protein
LPAHAQRLYSGSSSIAANLTSPGVSAKTIRPAMATLLKRPYYRILDAAARPVFVNTIKLLEPVAYDLRLRRVGRERDGGYVVPEELLDERTTLLSFGVADDVSFEEEVSATFGVKRIHCFDPTVDRLPSTNPHLTFHQLGIAAVPDPNRRLATFSGCRAQCDMGDHERIAIKMDVEGWEWGVLRAVDFSALDVDLMVLELHFFFEMTRWQRRLYPLFLWQRCRTLSRVLRSYAIVYSHANNYHYKELAGYRFPEFLELTLVSRRFLKQLAFEKSTALHVVNLPENPDFQFPYRVG